MNKIIYLLKFEDLEVQEICLKKFTRLFAAQRAAKTMRSNGLIKLICIDKYNCNTLERETVERYNNG